MLERFNSIVTIFVTNPIEAQSHIQDIGIVCERYNNIELSFDYGIRKSSHFVVIDICDSVKTSEMKSGCHIVFNTLGTVERNKLWHLIKIEHVNLA